MICMEKIKPSNGDRVTLRCTHAFHGQCICNHLVHDGRCPICRDSPYELRLELFTPQYSKQYRP